MNKTELPAFLDAGTVHGCSNGNFNKWDKVTAGKKDFLSKYKDANKAVKEVSSDEEKLEAFMVEYADELHELMLNDSLQDYSDVESGYPWHFEA